MASVLNRHIAEIAAQREAEHAAQASLDRIERNTQTINRGMANPLVWLFCIGGIVGIPFSGGLSILAIIVAILIATGGGKPTRRRSPRPRPIWRPPAPVVFGSRRRWGAWSSY